MARAARAADGAAAAAAVAAAAAASAAAAAAAAAAATAAAAAAAANSAAPVAATRCGVGPRDKPCKAVLTPPRDKTESDEMVAQPALPFRHFRFCHAPRRFGPTRVGPKRRVDFPIRRFAGGQSVVSAIFRKTRAVLRFAFNEQNRSTERLASRGIPRVGPTVRSARRSCAAAFV